MNRSNTSHQGLSRTQIYLSAEQQIQLGRLSRQNTCSKSELIRHAIDSFLASQQLRAGTSKNQQAKGLRLLTGLWKDRDEMKNPGEYIRKMREARF